MLEKTLRQSSHRSLFSQPLFAYRNILSSFQQSLQQKSFSGEFFTHLEIYKENFRIGKLVLKKQTLPEGHRLQPLQKITKNISV